MIRVAPEVLYRPPSEGEKSAHAHRVRKVTNREIEIKRAAEDGTLAAPKKSAEGTWTLSRKELEQYGYTLHSTTRTRFYLSKEAAEDTE